MTEKRISSYLLLLVTCIVFLLLLRGSDSFANLCRADINSDGTVDTSDMIIMRAEMGRDNCDSSSCQADLNADGKVSSNDLEILQSELGRSNCSADDANVPPAGLEMIPVEEGAQSFPAAEAVESFPVESGEGEEIEEDVEPLSTRFTDNKDGTVTDSETGLMWTEKANLSGDTMLFHQALDYIEEMNRGSHPNFGYTDWRLPTLAELRSLIDYSKLTQWGHILPPGHPFKDIKSLNFNSRGSYITTTDLSLLFSLYCRLVGHNVDSCYGYVWAVRDAGNSAMQ